MYQLGYESGPKFANFPLVFRRSDFHSIYRTVPFSSTTSTEDWNHVRHKKNKKHGGIFVIEKSSNSKSNRDPHPQSPLPKNHQMTKVPPNTYK